MTVLLKALTTEVHSAPGGWRKCVTNGLRSATSAGTRSSSGRHPNSTSTAYRRGMADGFVLFREFLRSPTAVATVTASSDALIEEMLRPFPVADDPVVVELGAGSGRMTDAVQRRLAGRGRHIAVELNPTLADRLAARHPDVDVVCASATELPAVLARLGVGQAHLVASLLPWQAYASGPIARHVAGVLAPDGVFTQATLTVFGWMKQARTIDRQVRVDFPEVRMSPTVWRNLPPARVRVARSAAAA